MNTLKRQSPPLSEKVFLQQVLALAALTGWKVHRNWTEIHSPKGWPDLFLAREREDGTVEAIALELKSEKGQLTEPQREWLGLLGRVPGVKAGCYRPSQWEEIVTLLKGGK